MVPERGFKRSEKQERLKPVKLWVVFGGMKPAKDIETQGIGTLLNDIKRQVHLRARASVGANERASAVFGIKLKQAGMRRAPVEDHHRPHTTSIA